MEALVKPINGKIQILQVMRGIAALGIVYFHTEYGPWKSANWGVDFFFVLSGYLLMVSTERYGGGVRYWKNKLLRICPLYYLMTVVIAIGWKIYPAAFRSTVVTPETLLKSFLFIPCYAENGKIYPVYSVAWTLNLEMFFYVVAFLVIVIDHKHRGAILMTILTGLAVYGIYFSPEQVVLKFWTQQQLLDFVVGIGIFEAEKRCPKLHISRVTSYVLLILSVPFLFFGRYIYGSNFSYFCNVFWCGIGLAACVFGLKQTYCPKWSVWLGDISYPLYMTHFLVVGLACRVIMKTKDITLKSTVLVVIIICISVAAAGIVDYVLNRTFVLIHTNKTKVKTRTEG